MDFSTLPLEMIASVAKYLDHAELVRLRKLSTLVDTVAQRYGSLVRIPVENFWFDFKTAHVALRLDERVSQTYNLLSTYQINTTKSFKLRSNKWQQLLPLLDKIKITKFGIANRDFETIRQGLQVYPEAFSQCTVIDLSWTRVECRRDEFADFMNLFPKAVEIYASPFGKMNYILNYEFISSRKWNRVKSVNADLFQYNELDDRVLDVIVANRTALVIDAQTNFTLEAVARSLRAWSNGGKSVRFSQWGILNIRETKQDEAIELLRAIPGIQVEWNPDLYEFRVTFQRDPDMFVDFHLPGRYVL